MPSAVEAVLGAVLAAAGLGHWEVTHVVGESAAHGVSPGTARVNVRSVRSEEHTSELQSLTNIV